MIEVRSSLSPGVVTATWWRDGGPLPFDAFVDGLASDTEVRRTFLRLLREAPFEAFCWEMPAFTSATLGRACELTLVDSPALARVSTDPEPFAEHFTRAGGARAVEFPSLGGDAWLLAPVPTEPVACCAHLAAFVRRAPEDDVHALWAAVSRAVRARAGARPTWLSTAGLGVSWLHVRLDSRPKYYRTARFRVP